MQGWVSSVSKPIVKDIGSVTDEAGMRVVVGMAEGTVTLRINEGPTIELSDVLAEDFAQLFVSACWQAGRAAPP
jgi:hypothetical protein